MPSAERIGRGMSISDKTMLMLKFITNKDVLQLLFKKMTEFQHLQNTLGNNLDMKQFRKLTLVKFGKELKEKNIGESAPLLAGNFAHLPNDPTASNMRNINRYLSQQASIPLGDENFSQFSNLNIKNLGNDLQ